MIDKSVFQDKKALYYTLGCKLNFAETSTIGQALKEVGFRTVKSEEEADLIVVNTCSVTEVADKKCRQAISKLRRHNPHAFIAVTGCYAQLKPKQVASLPGVDLVLGADQKDQLIAHLGDLHKHSSENEPTELLYSKLKDINHFIPSCSRGDRTRYFLKVQDGCDYFCTYCTIPLARGKSRNGTISSLVKQAEEVASQGGKEIVLTGVNIGDFGRSTGDNLLQLIQALDEVEGIERYRISSIEPNLLSEDIIRFCAKSKRFMPHFHIPLQSGSDEVLSLMHRRYDTALFASRIALIKKLIPHCFIGVDVIVGTRGETQDYFDQAVSFIKGLAISQLHVFSYSERPGTSALRIEHKVSPQEKQHRSKILLEISEEKRIAFYNQFVGQEAKILLEHNSKGDDVMHGFTENYIRVEVPSIDALDNHLVSVNLGELTKDNHSLKGEILKA